MRRWLTVTLVVMAAFSASMASAQESGPSAKQWEVTGFPGGGIVFTEGPSDTGEPGFANYALGASLTYNWNAYWGVEGEVAGGLGVDQRITFGQQPSIGDTSPPDLLTYNANLLFYPVRNDRRLTPYVTGGIGGLTMFSEEAVAFDDDETFLVGNVGGGLTYYFGRWGVRGDYRFFVVDSKEDAPAFFGRGTRYGHRVVGGIVIGFGQ